jgi:sugar phosphate isomerase/epimerase
LILGAPLAAGILTATRGARARAADAPRNPVACQTNAWQIKQNDFAELLARLGDLKGLGYEAFECNVRFVKGQFSRGREARAEIEKTGVAFYGSHVGLRLAVDEIEPLVEGVAALGATRFVLSGAGKALTDDGRLDQKALAAKTEAITRVASRCRRAGLRLTYHNHRTEFLEHGAEVEAIVQRTDPELVWLLLDVGHAFLEKADVPAFLRRHHRRIDALHIRDIRGGVQVPLGEGEFPLSALADAIRSTGWPGYLTLEEEGLKTDDRQRVESVLRSGRQVIRKNFGV